MLSERALSQEARIRELEEILCPCGVHDFITVRKHFEGGTGHGDELTVYHKVCKRCKKRVYTITP